MRARAALCAFLLAGAAAAQELQTIGPTPAEVLLGDAASLRIVYEGSGTPEVAELPRVAGLRIQVFGPTVETRSIIAGGVREEARSVSWRLSLRPEHVGKFEIPPVTLKLGRRVLRSKPVVLRCVEDLFAAQVAFVEAEITPPHPWFRQAVTVRLRFGLDAALQNRLVPFSNARLDLPVLVEAPWLDDFPAGIPPEAQRRAEREGLSFALNGREARARPLGRRTRGGRSFAVFELTRRFLLDRGGSFELKAPVLSFQLATKMGRDLFGDLVVRESRRVFAHGKKLAFRVRPLPAEGRPKGFTNAVGRFRLEARLDKNRVKVGEPFRLTLELSGSGNLEFVDPPALDDLPGFHRFGLKVERSPGRLTASYDFAALDASVHAFPPVPFAAFDPGEGRYVDLSTKALSLEVLPAKRRVEIEAPPPAGEALRPGIDDIFDRLPAARPLPPPWRPRPWQALLAWLVPVGVVLGLARLFARARRLARDPKLRARREAWRRLEARLAAEGPLRAFAGFLADRFGLEPGEVLDRGLSDKLTAAGLPEERAREARALLERLEAMRYAGGDEVQAAGEVRAFAERLRREVGP